MKGSDSLRLTESMPRSLLFLPLFLVVFLSSCGYTLVGHGRTLSPSIRSIAIPILENGTSEPNIEVTVSNVLVTEFILDGRLKVSKRAEADLVVEGTVHHYDLLEVSFDVNNKVETYRLELGLNVSVKNSKNGENVLKQSFQGKWDFNATGDIIVTEPQRAEAITKAAKDAARKFISILIEGF
ncbi:MAG: LPS assembly lipoprotein LptE [Nitrospinota bacterium]